MKTREEIMGKIAGIVQTCPEFFDWDYCENNCEFYRFCDTIMETLNAAKATEQKKSIVKKIKETVEKVKESLGEGNGAESFI